eukprot:m.38908 g.38908  ORF g.38908 m.38908 type:complete len:314 (-) comp10263_c0_seq1:2733-3674(-)
MAARYTRPTLPEVCQAQQLRVQIHKALVHALSNRKHRITGQDRAQASPSETAQSATTTATHLLSSVLEVALDTLCYQQSGGSFVESIFALTRVHTPFIASHDHKNNQDGDKPCAPTPHFGTSLLSSRKLLSSVIAQVLAVVETRESSLPSAAALALTLVKLTEWALLLLFTLGIAPTFTLDAWLLNLAIAPLMSQTPHLAIKRRQLYFLASKLPLIRRIFMKTGETLASVAGTLSLLLPMAIWYHSTCEPGRDQRGERSDKQRLKESMKLRRSLCETSRYIVRETMCESNSELYLYVRQSLPPSPLHVFLHSH